MIFGGNGPSNSPSSFANWIMQEKSTGEQNQKTNNHNTSK